MPLVIKAKRDAVCLFQCSLAENGTTVCLYFHIFILNTKDGSTVRYASIFARRYGTLVRYAFFVMERVRYVGTVRLFCNGTGTVRWYGTLQKLN